MNPTRPSNPRRVVDTAPDSSGTVLAMTQTATAPEVHTHQEADEFWIMADPDADTSSAVDAATTAGFTTVVRSWFDPEHGWDVLVFKRN